jgi:hypothetical protein
MHLRWHPDGLTIMDETGTEVMVARSVELARWICACHNACRGMPVRLVQEMACERSGRV